MCHDFWAIQWKDQPKKQNLDLGEKHLRTKGIEFEFEDKNQSRDLDHRESYAQFALLEVKIIEARVNHMSKWIEKREVNESQARIQHIRDRIEFQKIVRRGRYCKTYCQEKIGLDSNKIKKLAWTETIHQ